MAITTQQIDLKFENNYLVFNEDISVPIQGANWSWATPTDVNVRCQTPNGKETNYTLFLESEENVTKCFDLLIKNTNVHLPDVAIEKLEPTLEGKITFVFNSYNRSANIFKHIASSFFPKEKFEHQIANGNSQCRYTIAAKSQDNANTTAYFNQALKQIDDRTFGHHIAKQLKEINHPNFPPFSYTPVDDSAVVGPDYSGSRERSFYVYADKIQEHYWVQTQSLTSFDRALKASSDKEIKVWMEV
jgi:hypothetical protein